MSRSDVRFLYQKRMTVVYSQFITSIKSRTLAIFIYGSLILVWSESIFTKTSSRFLIRRYFHQIKILTSLKMESRATFARKTRRFRLMCCF